jgi:hypothetical protein
MFGASRRCKASAVTSHLFGLAVPVGSVVIVAAGEGIAVPVARLALKLAVGSVRDRLQARAGRAPQISKKQSNLFMCQASPM